MISQIINFIFKLVNIVINSFDFPLDFILDLWKKAIDFFLNYLSDFWLLIIRMESCWRWIIFWHFKSNLIIISNTHPLWTNKSLNSLLKSDLSIPKSLVWKWPLFTFFSGETIKLSFKLYSKESVNSILKKLFILYLLSCISPLI